MSFLFPLYLLGALAVTVPIYLHLRRKPPKDSIDFSSLMFLEPTKHQPIKRRSQLENWPLLLLRCLALLALAAIFSRPFFAKDDDESAGGLSRTVLLIDTSASMRREGLWDQAIEDAKETVTAMRPEGALALVACGATPSTLIGFSDWNAEPPERRAKLATEALESLRAGWSSTDLGAGLLAAAELLADEAVDDDPLPARVVVVSDMQAGAALDSVADAAWPASLSVSLLALESDESSNASLSVAAASDRSKIAVRVRNAPDSERSEFSLQAGETKLAAVVPAGESRVFEFDAGADRVELRGDDHAFDNTLYLAPREPRPVRICFLGSGEADDSNAPEYFFRRAYSPSPILRPEFVDDLADEPAIIVIARPLDRGELAAVGKALAEDARALCVLTSTEMAETLGELLDLSSTPELEERDARYALLENIDFEHPTLRSFSDPRWRDFTGVHFWRHRSIDPTVLPAPAQIVAEFDDGSPAWIEFSKDEGAVFVMTSGWHPRDSQLSLSSKFLPLLFSIFSDVGPRVGSPQQFFVDDPLPLEEAESLAGGAPSSPREPGVYRTAGGAVPRSFAVNLKPSESDLAPVSAQALAALGVPIEGSASIAKSGVEEGDRRLRSTESEAQQNVWRWVVIALLVLLLIESWFAGRPASASAPSPPSNPSPTQASRS